MTTDGDEADGDGDHDLYVDDDCKDAEAYGDDDDDERWRRCC